MPSRQYDMTAASQLEMARERAAISRVEAAMETIAKEFVWCWHWGDGLGGWVHRRIDELAYRDGFSGTNPSPSWDDSGENKPGKPDPHIISRGLRTAVFERDKYRCKHCDTHLSLCCDHIIPKSKGGPTTIENLQTLCRPCNSKKGAKLP